MIKALIIEDEPKIADEMRSMLASLRPDISVLGTLESVEDSIGWFQANESPDLIFSDIQLTDGQSFDIFKKVKIGSPIIFCTAYDEYMLRAFETNGIAYILKPLTINKLEESLKKYEDLKNSFDRNATEFASKISRLIEQVRPTYQATLLVNLRERIVPVRTEDIACFHYDNGVVAVSLFNEQQYFVQEPLDDLEVKLNPHIFFRANRQFIINRNGVKDIERYFSRKLIVKLSVKTPESIVISKNKSMGFLKWVEDN